MAAKVSQDTNYLKPMPSLDTASIIQHVLGELNIFDDEKTDASPNGVEDFVYLHESTDLSVASELALGDGQVTRHLI